MFPTVSMGIQTNCLKLYSIVYTVNWLFLYITTSIPQIKGELKTPPGKNGLLSTELTFYKLPLAGLLIRSFNEYEKHCLIFGSVWWVRRKAIPTGIRRDSFRSSSVMFSRSGVCWLSFVLYFVISQTAYGNAEGRTYIL